MKKSILLTYTIILSIFISNVLPVYITKAAVPKGISVFLNGKMLKFDVEPYIKNGRTMVPFRQIFESLGLDIQWNGAKKTILATNNSSEIFIEIGKTFSFVNNFKIEMDASPQIVNGRTFVPLRFVSENTGAEVNWDGYNKKVYITHSFNKYKLGEFSYYRDLSISVDRLLHVDNSTITIQGRANQTDKLILIEVYDAQRKRETGLINISGQDGDFYLYESSINLSQSFTPKTIIIKSFNDSNKQVKISEYEL